MTFPDRIKLRNHHRLIHLNINNFECQHCDRRFSKAAYLERHIATAHGGEGLAPVDGNNAKEPSDPIGQDDDANNGDGTGETGTLDDQDHDMDVGAYLKSEME